MFYNTSDSIDRMIATHAFLKTKLLAVCVKIVAKFLQKTIFKNFCNDGTDSYPSKILTRQWFANIIIIIIIIIINDLYSAFRSEDTEALDAAQED